MTKKKKTIVMYSNARPGAGKTNLMLSSMARDEDRYIMAVDRTSIMDERVATLKQICPIGGTAPDIITIHQEKLVYTESVRKEINFCGKNYTADHQIIFTTHAGLRISKIPMENQKTMTLLIDEVPDAWSYIRLDELKPLRGYLKQFFRISTNDTISSKNKAGEEVGKWYRLTAIKSLPWDSIASDLKPILLELYKCARGEKLYVSDDNFDGESCRCFSVWDFKNISGFKNVVVMANGFDKSITFKLMEAQGVKLIDLEHSFSNDGYMPRKVIVEYLDPSSSNSRFYFASEPGIKALQSITKHFSNSPLYENLYWMCNKDNDVIAYSDHLKITGLQISPKCAGTNSLMAHNHCAAIYTSKPADDEFAALRDYLADGGVNIERADVIQAREIETLIQFLFRSSIRNPKDDRTVLFVVHNKGQADAICDFLNSLSLPLRVICADAGTGLRRRSSERPGPKPKLTEAEKKKNKRDRDKERMRIKRAYKQAQFRRMLMELNGISPI